VTETTKILERSGAPWSEKVGGPSYLEAVQDDLWSAS
jgi:hypothetical protein